MTRVGLTGGIGSGKSIICQIFRLLGAPVFHADEEAKQLYESHEEVRRKIKDLFGERIYTAGKINRKRLTELIFYDKKLLAALQRILHPEVAKRFEHWCSDYAGQPYVIHEAAILFESGADRRMDVCIAVTAPENVRLERILKRPDMTREMAARIMENQMPEVEKADRSQYVIRNDGMQLVIPQVLRIHHALMNGKMA